MSRSDCLCASFSCFRSLASSFSWKAWRAARICAARAAGSVDEVSRVGRTKPKALSKDVRELGEVADSMDRKVSPLDLDCAMGEVSEVDDWE